MVSNRTHGWSQAVFNIPIAYGEDVDRAIEVLTELARELRSDPEYSLLIMDDPEMLGVDQLAESSVIIKFTIKTRPLKLWTVKREMLRRVKRRFDELHIEIPPPQRIAYYRRDARNEDHAPWGDESADHVHDGNRPVSR
jgi:small conductance mechanosensitive channel